MMSSSLFVRCRRFDSLLTVLQRILLLTLLCCCCYDVVIAAAAEASSEVPCVETTDVAHALSAEEFAVYQPSPLRMLVVPAVPLSTSAGQQEDASAGSQSLSTYAKQLLAQRFPHGTMIKAYGSTQVPSCDRLYNPATSTDEGKGGSTLSQWVSCVTESIHHGFGDKQPVDLIWIELPLASDEVREEILVRLISAWLLSDALKANGVVAINGYQARKAARLDGDGNSVHDDLHTVHPSDLAVPLLRYVLDLTTVMLGTAEGGVIHLAWPLRYPEVHKVGHVTGSVSIDDFGVLLLRKSDPRHR